MHDKTKEELITEIHSLHHQITEMKKALSHHSEAAEALHETRHNLEMRIQQRTSELARTNVELREEIAQRKKVESELRTSEELYRGVVDNIGIGVAMMNPAMEVLAMNKQMKAWFPGVNVNDRPICYRVFNDPPRDAACPYCPTRKTIEDGDIHEASSNAASGESMRNFRIVSSPIKDSEGAVIAAVKMMEDVTYKAGAV